MLSDEIAVRRRRGLDEIPSCGSVDGDDTFVERRHEETRTLTSIVSIPDPTQTENAPDGHPRSPTPPTSEALEDLVRMVGVSLDVHRRGAV
jgi:hypothetical protein